MRQAECLTISGVTYSNITVGTFHAAPGQARKAAAAGGAARRALLVTLIHVKFGTAEGHVGPLGRAKFHANK